MLETRRPARPPRQLLVLLGILALAHTADLLSTWMMLASGQVGAREANPLMAGVLQAGGYGLAAGIKLVGTVAVAGLIGIKVWQSGNRGALRTYYWAMRGLILFITLVAALNFFQATLTDGEGELIQTAVISTVHLLRSL